MNSVDFHDNGHAHSDAATENHDSYEENGDKSDILSEIAALLNTDLPEGRINLVDNHTNLEHVAEYCEANYFQSENKRAALEETKNYTTQSLASVAYQINTLAFNFSQLLDLETTQLQNMETDLNYISQIIAIHKEKVARREIGVLTGNKVTGRKHKIIALPNQEKPIKYVRKPIDFTVLDKIGHGCKIDKPDSSVTTTGTIKAHHKQRGNSQSSIHSGVSNPAPTTKPPTPPELSRAPVKIVAGGTLSKGSREYRTPPAVAPPQVPSHYAPNYPRKPGYSTLPFATPQIGLVTPQHYAPSNVQIQSEIYKSSSINRTNTIISSSTASNDSKSHSPPLPSPPPMLDLESQNGNFLNRTSSSHLAPIVPHDADLPGWVPKNYIEKVIAIYDYYADKEDELSFQESAVIYVLKKNDDGWWEGVMDGITGLFPGNYVESCV